MRYLSDISTSCWWQGQGLPRGKRKKVENVETLMQPEAEFLDVIGTKVLSFPPCYSQSPLLKGTQACDNFEIFFLPKSNPYMPFVNFRKKFRFFSFDFRQNFDVRTFPRWLSIRGTKFFFRDIQKIFFLNLHFGPIRWVPRRFFKILIFYRRNLHFN